VATKTITKKLVKKYKIGFPALCCGGQTGGWDVDEPPVIFVDEYYVNENDIQEKFNRISQSPEVKSSYRTLKTWIYWEEISSEEMIN